MQPRDNAVAVRASKASRSGTHRVPIELRESNHAHEALARKYRTYYELYEGAPLAYLVTDANGVITHVNRQACALLNAGARFLAGKTLTSMIARADRARVRDLIAVMSDVVLHTEVRVQPRAEEAAWVSIIGQRAVSHDDGVCIRWLMRNARVQREEDARRDAAAEGLQARIFEAEANARRVGHFLKREQEARQAAEQGVLYKNRVLAELTHDLTAPLCAIQGWLQRVDQHPQDDRARKLAIANVTRTVQDLIGIVDDLRDHARIEAHQAMLKPEPLDLARVVADVMAECCALAGLKQISVAFTAEKYGIPMSGDPLRLRQVFRSVLCNAIKFTPEHGHIRVAVTIDGGYADVIVTDTGRGIEPAALANLFEPFAHARSAAARKDGLGLGLSIAQRLIELHGGTIEARSAGANRGASFRVRLPILQ